MADLIVSSYLQIVV